MTDAIKVGQTLGRTGPGILDLVEENGIGMLVQYNKGEVLFFQGDLADCAFVVRKGDIKLYCVSLDGKAHTYEILGAGRLVGATAHLHGGQHESTAEPLEDADVYVIPRAEFTHLLSSDPRFSMAVMRELAQTACSLACQVRSLSFLGVQQRLKHELVRLAGEHGLTTDRGIRINLNITHEQVAELVAANRSTISTHIGQLKSQGYLWKEGRHLVIIPPEHIDILDTLSQAVVDGDEEGTMGWARKAVEGGVDPAMALDALTSGMKYVAKGFVQEQLGLPDVLVAAVAMKSAMPIVEEGIRRTGKKVEVAGTVVMGTVHGDIHDIGKTIVATLLAAQGFEAIDLGANVAAEEFVWAVTKHRPDVLAMSALMTTTAPEPGKVINALKEEGIRDKVKVVVGGGAVTEKLAQRIGADGYGATAREAVTLVRELTAGKREK